MIKQARNIFRLRNILIIGTILSLTSLVLCYCSPYVHPETLSILPLFGLAYWIILFVNVGVLIVWSILRSRWTFVVLFVLLAGGRIHFRAFSFGSNDENLNGTELKIMSYNVRLFDLYGNILPEHSKTKNKILNYVKNKQPDVLCFQEFYHQDAPTSFITRDTLIQILGSIDHHERYNVKLARRQNFGVALFSKFPIIEKGNVTFQDKEGSNNFCIYADIVKNKDTLRIYNVHLQSIRLQKEDYAVLTEGSDQKEKSTSNIFTVINKIRKAYPVRAKQAEQICNHMKNSKYPVVVCGDFNDTPLSYSYNLFSTQLVDAFRNTSFGVGTTYAGSIPAGRIDYIFHSPKLGSKNFDIQQEKLSDHYAIDCTIFMKKVN